MTSIPGEPRMLERRISNQRAELNNDQQMNYLLAWFNNWSDLQKEDFVPVLAEKMSSKWAAVNGLTEDMKSMAVTNSGRPVSLFQCQVGSLDIAKLISAQIIMGAVMYFLQVGPFSSPTRVHFFLHFLFLAHSARILKLFVAFS